jgi:hypothetical protein
MNGFSIEDVSEEIGLVKLFCNKSLHLPNVYLSVYLHCSSSHIRAARKHSFFMITVKQPLLDTAAMLMAVVCGIHCLLTPLLLVFLPVLASSLWVHEDFHGWMLFLVVPTTILAVYMGCKEHSSRRVVVFSGVGLAFLVLGFVVGHFSPGAACCSVHSAMAGCSSAWTMPMEISLMSASLFSGLSHFSLNTESILTSLGGLFLAYAHITNFRLCRRRLCCDRCG